MIIEPIDGAALEASLRDALADERLAEAIASITAGQTAEVAQEAERLLRTQRDEFLSAVEEVLDDVDRAFLVTSRYVEQKARWIQMNLESQYRMMFKGEADQLLMCRAAVTSFLLAQIEPFIDAEQLATINSLLAQPMAA